MHTLPAAPFPAVSAASFASCALVVAHPGHELRVYGWMEAVRPLVFVLTDGSGSAGEARLESSTRVLARTLARPGSIYGWMSDRAIYSAILSHDHAAFRRIADQLAETMAAEGIDCVAGDAVEGYNPSHDVCRLVTNAAVRMAARARGAPIAAYEFALVGAPDECAPGLRPRAIRLELDEQTLARKLEAARGYPELTGEVEHALRQFGLAPFRTEYLRPVDPGDRYGGWDPDQVPYYERYGEKRVAEGVYDRVLRFREHVRPLADALWDHTERQG
ncbi:MAG TPA: hypothetical protein VHG08_14265 [Longimicrobium sp.]|nr:hypothetical protein [Longimicrobium sp.]